MYASKDRDENIFDSFSSQGSLKRRQNSISHPDKFSYYFANANSQKLSSPNQTAFKRK